MFGSDILNRKKKFIIIGIVAIFYLIIVVNFHKIRFALSILRLYGQEKNIDTIMDHTENTKPIVDNPLQSILDSEEDEDKSDIYVDIVNKSQNTENAENKIMDKSIDEVADKAGKIVDNKKPYKDIINEYNTILEDLRATFESELDSLIKQGIQEYSKGEISNTKLANKYLSIGSDLEKSSDDRFDKVLKEMEKELKNNEHAISIIKDIKEYYFSFKNAKKIDLINRGMKHIK